KFPSSGMYALEENIQGKRPELVALGRVFAMGQVFAMANPEAAVHILWEIFPQTKPTGIDEATALTNEVKLLKARAQSWSLDADKMGVKRWGESVGANYQGYYDWLLQQNVIRQKLDAKDAFTNELIDDINMFDAAEVTAMARAYKAQAYKAKRRPNWAGRIIAGRMSHEPQRKSSGMAGGRPNARSLLGLFRRGDLRSGTGANFPRSELELPVPGGRAGEAKYVVDLLAWRDAGGCGARREGGAARVRESVRTPRGAALPQGPRGGSQDHLRLSQLDLRSSRQPHRR